MTPKYIDVTVTVKLNAREIERAGFTGDEIREGLRRAVRERAKQYLGDGGEVTEVK